MRSLLFLLLVMGCGDSFLRLEEDGGSSAGGRAGGMTSGGAAGGGAPSAGGAAIGGGDAMGGGDAGGGVTGGGVTGGGVTGGGVTGGGVTGGGVTGGGVTGMGGGVTGMGGGVTGGGVTGGGVTGGGVTGGGVTGMGGGATAGGAASPPVIIFSSAPDGPAQTVFPPGATIYGRIDASATDVCSARLPVTCGLSGVGWLPLGRRDWVLDGSVGLWRASFQPNALSPGSWVFRAANQAGVSLPVRIEVGGPVIIWSNTDGGPPVQDLSVAQPIFVRVVSGGPVVEGCLEFLLPDGGLVTRADTCGSPSNPFSFLRDAGWSYDPAQDLWFTAFTGGIFAPGPIIRNQARSLPSNIRAEPVTIRLVP